MLISESHKFIFIAVPKTSSMEKALAPYDSPLTRKFKKHATCPRLQKDLPPDIWNEYFKFAIVRNPYDCIQSWYFYRQREELANPQHPRHKLYTGHKSFDEFVENFGKDDWILTQSDSIAPTSMGGVLQVDFVGRYENLDKDYRHICEQIAVPYQPLPSVRRSANSERPTGLWTPHTRALANEYYHRDFELFDYETLER